MFQFLLIGCENNACLDLSGKDSVVEVNTGYFEFVTIAGMFDVELVQDSLYYIEFETKPELQNKLQAKVIDSVLWLHNTHECFYRRDFSKAKVKVHFADIRQVAVQEVSKIYTRFPITSSLTIAIQSEMAEVDVELNNEHINFYNHYTTGGDFCLRGYSEYAIITGFYTAKMKLDELETNRLKINNSSIGDFSVVANDELHVAIHNRGNIYYSGEAEVFIDSISGSGRLIHLD